MVALDLTDQASLAKLREMINQKKLTGVWDLNPFWSTETLLIPDWLRTLMDQKSVQFVYPEERITTDKLIVLDSLALQSQNPKRKPRWDVVDFEYDPEFKKTIKTLFPVSEL